MSKGSEQGHLKSEFKSERGDDKEGKLDPQKPVVAQLASPDEAFQNLKTSQKVIFLNPDPLNCWSRLESIAGVWIDGEDSWVLLDSGSTINAVTPEFVVFILWTLVP